MSLLNRILIFFILPIIAILCYPPQILAGGLPVIGVAVLIFLLLGWLLLSGYSTVLTLSIFMQGMNVIVRIMMVFSNAVRNGSFDLPFVGFNLIGIFLSLYLLLRMDRVDVRTMMVT